MVRWSGVQVVRWSGGQVVIKSVFLLFFNASLSKLLEVTKLVSDFFIPYLDFFSRLSGSQVVRRSVGQVVRFFWFFHFFP